MVTVKEGQHQLQLNFPSPPFLASSLVNSPHRLLVLTFLPSAPSRALLPGSHLAASVYLCTSALALYASYRLLQLSNPSTVDRKKSSKRGKEVLSRLGARLADKLVDLNEYEEVLLAEVVCPEDIEVGFGGELTLLSLLETTGLSSAVRL